MSLDGQQQKIVSGKEILLVYRVFAASWPQKLLERKIFLLSDISISILSKSLFQCSTNPFPI